MMCYYLNVQFQGQRVKYKGFAQWNGTCCSDPRLLRKIVMQGNLNMKAKVQFNPSEHGPNEPYSVRADVCIPALHAVVSFTLRPFLSHATVSPWPIGKQTASFGRYRGKGKHSTSGKIVTFLIDVSTAARCTGQVSDCTAGWQPAARGSISGTKTELSPSQGVETGCGTHTGL